MEKLKFLDKGWIGFLLGVTAPVITIIIVYFYSFNTNDYTFAQFIHFLKTMRVMSKLFSLCLLPNLLVFFLYIWADFNKGARGVLASTIVLAIIIVTNQFIAGEF